MGFRKDKSGQGGTEYLLLFGGVIVVAVMAILLYASYFGNPFSENVTVTLTMSNNGAPVGSSLRYEVYDKSGNLIVASRVLSGNSNGTFNIGNYPRGGTLKLHETLNGRSLSSTITTNIIITAYGNNKMIISTPIIEIIGPNEFKGARGNWYVGVIS
jgi:hypothetical protein